MAITNFHAEALRHPFGAVVVTGFILATLFFHLNNAPKGVHECLGFLAFAICTTFFACVDAFPAFLQERYIVICETVYNTYRRSSSYVLFNSLTALPALIYHYLAFAAISFFRVGLGGDFPFYFLIMFASFWAGSSFITFLSGVLPQARCAAEAGDHDPEQVELLVGHSGQRFLLQDSVLLGLLAGQQEQEEVTN
ncbi:ABC-2 type transporter family protein [Actinidia rufa]|uniref:ABC-2 type transporter family protein n=1 Tax=Actinidia rufa TaxID=165716 RepID=A0A7J0EE62_9ERIC|nr:ABC-2 type transporter family protein [Actinidia rufa]